MALGSRIDLADPVGVAELAWWLGDPIQFIASFHFVGQPSSLLVNECILSLGIPVLVPIVAMGMNLECMLADRPANPLTWLFKLSWYI